MEADVIYAVTEQGDLVAQLCPQGTCLSAVPKGQCRRPRSFRFGSKSDALTHNALPVLAVSMMSTSVTVNYYFFFLAILWSFNFLSILQFLK